MFEKILYLLLLFPTLTELLESGHLPGKPREWASDILLTVCMGVFIYMIIKRNRELVNLSETDTLTKVLNRRRFDIDLDREIIRAHRLNTQLVLAFIDIDNFKNINDQNGHVHGDIVLKNIGHLLKTSIRHHVDRCYRIGGDEFAIIFPEITKKSVLGVKDRINLIKSEAVEILSAENSSLSIGIVVLEEGETANDLVNRADRLMYKEKKTKVITSNYK